MIPVFIPFVNRPDLLEAAVKSVPFSGGCHVEVIDNSCGLVPDYLNVAICNPPVPLTFAQTQNWMLKIAEAMNDPLYLFMHSDAEAGEGAVQKLIDMARALTNEGRKWGVIFTAYDALAAFNTEALRAVGGWDTELSWYASDSDIYRRIRLSGYEVLESNLPVKHTPSQTLNSDPEIRRRVDLMFPYRATYYRAKWGGDIGHEVFTVPFNGILYR